jgi:hypothetical protein
VDDLDLDLLNLQAGLGNLLDDEDHQAAPSGHGSGHGSGSGRSSSPLGGAGSGSVGGSRLMGLFGSSQHEGGAGVGSLW